MAGIKSKISNLIQKDKDTSTAGAHETSGKTGGVAQGLKGAFAGYDATTSTGKNGAMSGNDEVSTGMADLDITTGTNKESRTVGPTTGLREKERFEISPPDQDLIKTHHKHEDDSTTDRLVDTTRTVDSRTGEIIDAKRFTKTEDHEVLIEKKAYELEHRPVQKKFVVETRYLGERAIPGKATELLSTETREVEERIVNMPHGDREVIIENVDLPIGTEVVDGHRVTLPHTHQEPHTSKFPLKQAGTNNSTAANNPVL